MKLKYYLRGLGTGIAVASLIIGISAGVTGAKTMTDEEILARAKQLGLVERTVLADMATESDVTEDSKAENIGDIKDENIKDESTKDESTKDESTKGESTKDESTTDENTKDESTKDDAAEGENVKDESIAVEDNAEPEGDKTEISSDDPKADEPVKEESNTKADEFGMPDEAGTVTITIVRGASSDSVSRLLEDAGLVDNASAYDKYLCQNGYDKSIRVGKYDIPADATGEEIAKIITGR